MKFLIVSLLFASSLNVFAKPLPELQMAEKTFECRVTGYSVQNDHGFHLVEYKNIDIYSFPSGLSTMVGIDSRGNEYLLSEDVPEDIRILEPYRGFFNLVRMMDGESYYLDLYNDSDRPESEIHITKTGEENHYIGKARVYWDFTQTFTVDCVKL